MWTRQTNCSHHGCRLHQQAMSRISRLRLDNQIPKQPRRSLVPLRPPAHSLSSETQATRCLQQIDLHGHKSYQPATSGSFKVASMMRDRSKLTFSTTGRHLGTILGGIHLGISKTQMEPHQGRLSRRSLRRRGCSASRQRQRIRYSTSSKNPRLMPTYSKDTEAERIRGGTISDHVLAI